MRLEIFYWQTLKRDIFRKKIICEEIGRDFIYEIISRHKIRLWRHISSLYKYCHVFRHKISSRTGHLTALCDNFEKFRKITFKWERNFKKHLEFCEFLCNFQSEIGLELTKDCRIEMRSFTNFIRKMFPLPSWP